MIWCFLLDFCLFFFQKKVKQQEGFTIEGAKEVILNAPYKIERRKDVKKKKWTHEAFS